jgi:hypothetical protein
VSLLEQPVALERFDYTRVGEHGALLRVLTRLSGEQSEPAGAELRVSRSERPWRAFAARGCRIETASRDGDASVWRGLFPVPFALVQQPEFSFELAASGLPSLALPRPSLRGALTLVDAEVTGSPQLGVTDVGELSAEQVARLTGGRLRTRAIALATALAVTASSTPALALADAGVGPASHAQITQHRIERLANFAAQRARAEAARKRARADRSRTSTSRSRSRSSQLQGGLTGTQLRGAGVTTKPRASRSGTAQCLPASTEKAARSRPARSAKAATHLGALAPLADAVHCVPPAAGAPAAGPAPTATRTPAPKATSPVPTQTNPAPRGTTTPAPTPPAPDGTATTPGATPTPTGGAGLGTVANPAPTGMATPIPTPTLAPTTPPLMTGSHPQPTSHPQLPITIPSHSNGGGSLRPLGGLSKRPPVKLGSGASTGGSALALAPSPPGFLGPNAWTGSVTTDPALTGALGNLANLLANGNTPPRFLIPIYMEAGRHYHVPWQVLAAINAVESDYGRNLSTSSAGAIGWMQFEPGTWKQYGVAVDGHSVPNPYDPRDAIFSAARYLAAAGAAQDVSRAIYAYNHATWYVDMVLTRARAIAAGIRPHTHTSRRGVVSAYFASWHGHWRGRYEGGLLSHYVRLIAAANMVSAANFPYVYGGGHEQPARFGPFDCSGSVSYVMQQAGYKVPTTVSGDIPIWKFPSGPGRVTIFYNPTHTFMRIGNRYFGTSGFARPGGGAGWFNTNTIPASYLANFREVHVPRLGVNSFAPTKPHKPSKHTHPSSHTGRTKPPRYLQQFSSTSPLQTSFPALLQLRFPSA